LYDGSRVLHIFLVIESKRGMGANIQPLGAMGSKGRALSAWRFWGFATKIIHLGMLKLKFCLKTFETYSLLYVSVLKRSILAIILFKTN